MQRARTKKLIVALFLGLSVLAMGAVLAHPVVAADESFKPTLSIPIPNVSLSAVSVTKDSGDGPGYVDIPWLAQYITGVYKYATYLASLLATVMFMVGGFQYVTAGDSKRAAQGKQRITDSIVGLLMVLGAYTLLQTVNPKLVQVTPLRIPVVAKKTFEVISSDNMTAATGHPAIPRAQMLAMIRQKAVAKGGPKFDCFVYGSIVHESGGRQDALGHDENATSTAFSVMARRNFINSGTFASGATFPPVGCNDKSCQDKGPVNDDKFDVTKPPEYGLDWRYSHGFGAGQSTFFKTNPPCPGKEDKGPGFRSGSLCVTIPEILNPEVQADVMVEHYYSVWRGPGKGGSNPAAAYVAYAGRIEETNPIIVSRVNVYNDCVSKL